MQSQPRCHPPTIPGTVGREHRCGRKTLGQPCWVGRKARFFLWPRAAGTEQRSQLAREKPLACQAALPHTACRGSLLAH